MQKVLKKSNYGPATSKCKCLTKDDSGMLNAYLWQDQSMSMNAPKINVQVTSNRLFERLDVYGKNTEKVERRYKIFFSFETDYLSSASFYSPSDNIIYVYGKETFSLLKGKAFGEEHYSIMERRHKDVVIHCMNQGQIIHSPLARGWVICTLMYDFTVSPLEEFKASCWTIHSQTKDSALLLNCLIENQTSIYG